MRLGFSLLNNWGIDDPQMLVDLAVQAEALGLDSVWVHDHVFNVAHVLERIGDRPYYEPLTLLTYVAARTRRVRLGTSVLVLPYHNPIRLAKAAATLDVLSGGRLILGVGVGAIEQEMHAMGSPFAERGAVTDEAIAVMRTLWREALAHGIAVLGEELRACGREATRVPVSLALSLAAPTPRRHALGTAPAD